MNILHEILYYCWRSLRRPTIAICPTQKAEKYLGFDAAFAPGKLLFLQFKAYSYDSKQKAMTDYFELDSNQHNLLHHNPQASAFYVFPDYKTHLELYLDKQAEYFSRMRYQILNKTWFVDARDIGVSILTIRRNQLATGVVPSLSWRDLFNRLASCSVGLRVTGKDMGFRLTDKQEEAVERIFASDETVGLFLGGNTSPKIPE